MLWNLRMDNTDAHKTKYKEERLYMSTNQNLMQHMWELIDRIKAADVAYYRDDNPTMTDREYDLLVDELKELEATIGLEPFRVTYSDCFRRDPERTDAGAPYQTDALGG